MAVDINLKNEIRVRRKSEWLCRGVPFPEGALTEVAALRLRNEVGEEVPLAAEKLGHWPDGSVKWALLQFPVSFDGNGSKTYSLDWSGEGGHNGSGPKIRLTKSENQWEVDNGQVRFVLPLSGPAFLVRLTQGDQPLLREVRAEIQDASGTLLTSELASDPAIEHFTDKMLVISQQGVHRAPDGRKLFACTFRVTVFAEADDIEMEYQFVHDEPFREVAAKPQVVQSVGHPSIDTDHPGMRELRAVRLVLAHEIDSVTEYATGPFHMVGNQGLISHPEPLQILLTEGIRRLLIRDSVVEIQEERKNKRDFAHPGAGLVRHYR